MTAFYTLHLRVRKKTATEPALDEPNLLYLANQKFGDGFEQFVGGPLERPRDWWHTRMNWLTWITTEVNDKGELICPVKLRGPAYALSTRIETLLAGEPSRVEELKPVQAEAAGIQRALF